MPLYRLLYRSEIALVGSDRDVERKISAIVAASLVSNAKVGLTGALSFTSGVFIQALEGEADAVEVTFERICRDLRHKSVRLLEFTLAQERAFPEWAMTRVAGSPGETSFQPLLGGFGAEAFETAAPATIIALMRSLIITGQRRADGSAAMNQTRRTPSST